MSNAIVVVNVSETLAALPSTLQASGAFVTQGGSNTTAQTLTFCASLAQLVSLLAAPVAISSLSWSGGVVTVTTSVPHGWTDADVIPVVIAGATPVGYNGTFTGTITGSNTLTYPLTGNPGSETIPGTVALFATTELQQMGTTFFAQGSSQGVFVLELGEGEPDAGVTAFTTWLTNNTNPQIIYSYLMPREWDANSNFIALAGNYANPNSQTYFFVTTVYANRLAYTGLKCVFAEVESPGIPATEFSLAAAFYVTLNYKPNSTNRVTPLSYSFVYGVTPYPLPGNQTTLGNLNTANVGFIGTGAEGGLSTSILFYGQLQDGNPFNFWFSADWTSINSNLNLSNEVINGSNNPLAPLYYDQNGINRLQNRTVQTVASAVSNGLSSLPIKATQLPAATFTANFVAGLYEGYNVVNAEPFLNYNQENPSDYSIGKYGGLAIVFTPSRGFKQIFVNLNVTNLIAGV